MDILNYINTLGAIFSDSAYTLDPLDLITILVIMAAMFLLINSRYLKLPSTIGLMILALCLSLFVVLGEWLFKTLNDVAFSIMTEYQFSKILLQVMLSFLLFAGALQIDLRKLEEEKWPIFTLATLGTLISTFVVGTLIFYILPFLGLHIDYIYCLLFGALISPTDPIAVLAMIKKSKVSKNLESQIAGESLFNDGVGVVVFLTILHVVTSGSAHEFEIGGTLLLFLQEVFGGILLGLLIGAFGFYLLKSIPNEFTEIEVLVTLSMVMGGATAAELLHVSGPLAMVTMGIMVGKEGRSEDLADVTGEYVYKFWHLLDEALNAILFILIGLQIIVIAKNVRDVWDLYLLAGGIAILIVLLARFIGVGIPLTIIRLRRKLPKYSIRTITWSGLRGGISVALALSLYDQVKAQTVNEDSVNLIVAMTYSVVLFSIIVQGLTIDKLFAKMEEADTENIPEQQEKPDDG